MYKIILYFILIYLILRILLFFIVPRLGNWYLKRHRNKFYHTNPGAARARERREKEGMHISQNTEHLETETDDIGEYVDFEEIKGDD